jgi:hypothetical protein
MIESRTVATLALTAGHSNQLARSHPLVDRGASVIKTHHHAFQIPPFLNLIRDSIKNMYCTYSIQGYLYNPLLNFLLSRLYSVSHGVIRIL